MCADGLLHEVQHRFALALAGQRHRPQPLHQPQPRFALRPERQLALDHARSHVSLGLVVRQLHLLVCDEHPAALFMLFLEHPPDHPRRTWALIRLAADLFDLLSDLFGRGFEGSTFEFVLTPLVPVTMKRLLQLEQLFAVLAQRSGALRHFNPIAPQMRPAHLIALGLKPVVSRVAVRRDHARLRVLKQLFGDPFGASLADQHEGGQGRLRQPNPVRQSLFAPPGLVAPDVVRGEHGLTRLRVSRHQRLADLLEILVHRALARGRAEDVLHKPVELAARGVQRDRERAEQRRQARPPPEAVTGFKLGARLLAAAKALAGVQTVFGAFNQFGHQLELLVAHRRAHDLLRAQLQAAVALGRIMVFKRVDLVFGEQLARGALVARLSAWSTLRARASSLALLAVLRGVRGGGHRRVDGIQAEVVLELVETILKRSVLGPKRGVLSFELGDASVARVDGVKRRHALRLTPRGRAVNLGWAAFLRRPAERLQKEIVKPYHSLLQDLEEELFNSGHIIDLTSLSEDTTLKSPSLRNALKSSLCIKCKGKVAIEDYERLKSISDNFPEIVKLVNRSAVNDILKSQEYVDILKEIEKYKNNKGKNRKIREANERKAAKMKKGLDEFLENNRAVDVIDPWILKGMKTWIDSFLTNITNIRLYPFSDEPDEHIFGHLDSKYFSIQESNAFHFTYGTFPSEDITMIGVVTSVPSNSSNDLNFLSEFEKEDLEDVEVIEKAFRGMFEGFNGFEAMIRTCRYPRILVQPILVYRESKSTKSSALSTSDG